MEGMVTPETDPEVDYIESRLELAIRTATDDGPAAEAIVDQAEAEIGRLGRDRQAGLRGLADAARGKILARAGQYHEASTLLRRALAATPVTFLRARVRILQALVFAAEKMGDVEEALDWAVRGLEAARLTDDVDLIAAAESSVGVARSRCGDAAGGLTHYERVLAHLDARGDEALSIPIRNNIGINLKNLGRLEESLESFQLAVEIADRLDRSHSAAVVRSNMGETLWRLGRHVEARDALAATIEAGREGGWPAAEVNALVNLGRVLTDMEEDADALAALERALVLAEGTEDRSYLLDAHQALADLHKRAGRFEAALAHFEAYHRAERAVFDANFERQVAALRVRLEVEEARHEAEVDRLRLVEIGRAHEELRSLHEALVESDAAKSELLARLDREHKTDALTGLLNRRSLDVRLAAAVDAAHHRSTPLTLAMCDIDRFKLINDQHGHPIGDVVLREVAALLRSGCRRQDIVARYGGEEFCIGFVDTDLDDAVGLADRLRRDVSGHDWDRLLPDLRVTLSVGVATLAQGGDAGVLLASADAWLYAAKREGRDRVRWRDRTDAA